MTSQRAAGRRYRRHGGAEVASVTDVEAWALSHALRQQRVTSRRGDSGVAGVAGANAVVGGANDVTECHVVAMTNNQLTALDGCENRFFNQAPCSRHPVSALIRTARVHTYTQPAIHSHTYGAACPSYFESRDSLDPGQQNLGPCRQRNTSTGAWSCRQEPSPAPPR